MENWENFFTQAKNSKKQQTAWKVSLGTDLQIFIEHHEYIYIVTYE